MSTEKKKIVLINASPRTAGHTASGTLLSLCAKQMMSDVLDIRTVHVRESMRSGRRDHDFADMLHADALVFFFPLYIFCLPGLLMRYLQDFHSYFLAHPHPSGATRVYAVVNCGFPEPDINEEAVRVFRSFSEKIDADFRFGILIGCGPMVATEAEMPYMKKTGIKLKSAFATLHADVLAEAPGDVRDLQIEAGVPRRLYFLFGDKSWVRSARRNGLKNKDIYRRPYRA